MSAVLGAVGGIIIAPMNLSDHILVLDYGKKLAEGTATEVRANPDVIGAYLGAPA